jgi:ATP-dependent Clp protease ATP-binding subunit ClpB
MNFNNYTIKSQEAIQKASEIASGNGQQAIEPGHVLKAILQTDENMVSFIIKKLNVNRNQLETRLDEIINGYPKVSGQQPYLSNDTAAALQKATGYLK